MRETGPAVLRVAAALEDDCLAACLEDSPGAKSCHVHSPTPSPKFAPCSKSFAEFAWQAGGTVLTLHYARQEAHDKAEKDGLVFY